MKQLILSATIALACLSTSIAQQKQPAVKSQKEGEALQAMFQAQDPDARIKAADYVLTKFADTEFKAIALYMTAASYEQKNDFEKMVVYAERTIEADPKNYASMLMLAGGIAKRSREHDLDLEEKLTRSDKYAKSALEALKDATKPNLQLTDAQWDGVKKDYNAAAHEAFGLAAMLRKKYDAAIAEFKQAVDGAPNPDPATMVYLAQVYNLAHQPDQAILVIDKVMALPDADAQIKQIKQAAQAARDAAIKAKGPAAAPTTPPAATPEPKKQ